MNCKRAETYCTHRLSFTDYTYMFYYCDHSPCSNIVLPAKHHQLQLLTGVSSTKKLDLWGPLLDLRISFCTNHLSFCPGPAGNEVASASVLDSAPPCRSLSAQPKGASDPRASRVQPVGRSLPRMHASHKAARCTMRTSCRPSG